MGTVPVNVETVVSMIFRYLQGYMGTTFNSIDLTAYLKFRYLQGYMGTGPTLLIRLFS